MSENTSLTPLQDFVSQLVALAWIRCAIDEGVKFINKETNKMEMDVLTIFRHFEHKTGLMDMPKAEVSPKGMERCLFETVGGVYLTTANHEWKMMLASEDFKTLINEQLETIKNKGKQFLRGSPIESEDESNI